MAYLPATKGDIPQCSPQCTRPSRERGEFYTGKGPPDVKRTPPGMRYRNCMSSCEACTTPEPLPLGTGVCPGTPTQPSRAEQAILALWEQYGKAKACEAIHPLPAIGRRSNTPPTPASFPRRYPHQKPKLEDWRPGDSRVRTEWHSRPRSPPHCPSKGLALPKPSAVNGERERISRSRSYLETTPRITTWVGKAGQQRKGNTHGGAKTQTRIPASCPQKSREKRRKPHKAAPPGPRTLKRGMDPFRYDPRMSAAAKSLTPSSQRVVLWVLSF